MQVLPFCIFFPKSQDIIKPIIIAKTIAPQFYNQTPTPKPRSRRIIAKIFIEGPEYKAYQPAQCPPLLHIFLKIRKLYRNKQPGYFLKQRQLHMKPTFSLSSQNILELHFEIQNLILHLL